MLVVHAYVDRASEELRATVTYANDLVEADEQTRVARSTDEVLDLVRRWLAGNGR
jgi:hypothetical protein